jgi:hypothetical protein
MVAAATDSFLAGTPGQFRAHQYDGEG